MTFRLGLTGSIGMGKSTTAAFFRSEGIAVWDADAAVHRLYALGGAAVAAIAALVPQAVENGCVSRETLRKEIARNPALLRNIEGIVHPLVADDRHAFLAAVTSDIAVLDIPLLFENGLHAQVDATLLVTAPPTVQQARVLARPGMTAATFDLILSRQMPDAQKRSLATHVVETLALDQTQAYVQALIRYIREANA